MRLYPSAKLLGPRLQSLIFLHALTAAVECVFPSVAPRIQALQTRLWHWLEKEYVLACMKDALERDTTYKVSLLFDLINETAYYNEEEEDVDTVQSVAKGSIGKYAAQRRDMDPNQPPQVQALKRHKQILKIPAVLNS
jgi:hypothetical protein